MISKFFIDRPIFAWVLAIIIMLAGVLAIFSLPIEQYPRIAPTQISINASYPGASAETLENSVTQIIEQQLTGIDYLRYFSSNSDSSGQVEITVTFDPEADPDIAQVQVQNKLQSAVPLLPQEVQQQGISVEKASMGFFLVAAFYSEDGKTSANAISDLLNSKILEQISRVEGVGKVTVFGQPYAMRIWVDPNKLISYNLSTIDVENAVRAQNADVSSGQLGGLPAVAGQQLNATITAQSRLRTVQDFQKILLRVNPDGSRVRLQDVARVEIGAQSYGTIARYQGKPATGMAISLASGANALRTAELVKAKIVELQPLLPAGVNVGYPFDTTPFVEISIHEVVKTLIEAVVLVFLVMLLFLQNLRATLIPTIAVPVVLLGTFAILLMFGYSINVLTMFAMVLAIGLLVDDAIVVVENVERLMREEGLSPREAAKKSMDQITGALIGIALVLSAVFIPMAFFTGSTGLIYRQFSITIVSAMGLSVLVAVVLTPALCATLLKPVAKDHHENEKGFSGWFNRNFNRARHGYGKSTDFVTHHAVGSFAVYLVLIAALVLVFPRIPTSFLPDEDQGNMFLQVVAPPGSTSERTLESVKQVEKYFLEDQKENVDSLFTVVGFSFAGRAQNMGFGFVDLKDWSERKRDDQKVFAISGQAMGAMSTIKDALVFAFFPPPILELGNATGFDMQLVDRGGLGHTALMDARNMMLGMASQNPQLAGVRPNGLDDVPQYKIEIDYEKAIAQGLSINEINRTLQTVWGSSYVNDFVHEGRIKKVFLQGDAPYRMLPEDVNKWYVRNNTGQMVPFSSFATGKWSYGPPKLERFNGTPSQNIQGGPAEGVSSGQAMQIMEDLAKKLPAGIQIAWSGLSYEERLAGSQTTLLYALSVLMVFLCLAALYESWSIPFAVLLVVPLGVAGAVAATYFSGLSNDVYFQVGLLTTIGLSAKNAILIVEFAKDLRDQGMDIFEAARTAALQRLRPIIMTSMAFVLGVTPLVLADGAGSAAQNAIGVGVIGGMLAATFLAIFFVPMFFVTVQNLFSRKKVTKNEDLF